MTGCLVRACLLLAGAVPAVDADADISPALNRLYNFDFSGADKLLDAQIAASPNDPIAYTFRGASLLFREMDRLLILESDFFADDDRIADKRRLKPDPEIKRRFHEAVGRARSLAMSRLAKDPRDADALFAMTITSGLLTDYGSFVERRQVASLQFAREAQRYGLQLLAVNPAYTDGYMALGISEYLVGSLPFFIRWFVKFEQVEGDKAAAVRNLEKVAQTGRYMGPFARILLSIIHLREKRYDESVRYLRDLARDYPENSLIRRELARIGLKAKKKR